MSNISVSIKTTKNPSILKFVHTSDVVNGSYEYNNIDEAKNSVLAQQLFHLPFVKKVFISVNFIAIEKFNIVEWDDIKNEISEQIESFLNIGGEIISTVENSGRKIAIEIYAESTPNPSVLKFVGNKMLVSQSFEFKNIDEAKESPIAVELFKFPFVKEVFISENYISITKYDIAEWTDISGELRDFIRNFIHEGKTIINESAKATDKSITSINTKDYDETSLQIISILDEYVKPAVASDGGNIQFASYEEESKTVNVILQGACSGCPSSTLTLKSGIENMLKQMIPNKIETVVAING